MADFRSAWANVRKNGDIYSPDLFASSIYQPQPQRRVHQLTQQQKAYRQAVYHSQSNIPWAEYNNPQNHRYTYSPTVAKAQHDVAMNLFKKAEYILSKAQSKERW